MILRRFCLLICILLLMLNSCIVSRQYADIVLYNGKVYTVDKKFSFHESLAVKNGKVIETGSTKAITRKYKTNKSIDLQGKTVYPGFYDGHCHFYHYGLNLQKADLFGVASYTEMLQRLKEHQKKFPNGWLTGMGWDQNLWADKNFPDNKLLNEAFPDIPVVLSRVDGHAVLLNSEAMRLTGINENTLMNKEEAVWNDGKLSGVFLENTADKAKNAVPRPSVESITQLLVKAQENCFAVGLTSVADAGLEKREITIIDSLQKQGVLKMKVYAMLNPSEENFETYVKVGTYQTDRLHIASVKLYADGALGSMGALLKNPYSDADDKTGILANPVKKLETFCRLAYQNGFQVNTHCIGDSAVNLMLGIYGKLLKGQNDLRWRIEHAQIVSPSDFAVFEKFSVIPSVQATHATSDMFWAGQRLGEERLKNAYAYKKLLNQNGWIINGTDFPIENISPLLTFYAAVSRKNTNGKPESGFQIENALTREEALRSITIWAAKGAFEEKEKGSLESGKAADFVVLDGDIMTLPESSLPHVKIIMTFSNGEEVYPLK
ncbi:MAG: amidohydrolase [Lentimicrobiaceae bacterium]|nr:amidohydrolase [Lentimicrobiaceae bacterium]